MPLLVLLSVQGERLRPGALDVSPLLCGCPAGGLAYDPTDSLLLPVRPEETEERDRTKRQRQQTEETNRD